VKERLKEIRKYLSLNQKDFALKIGVTPSAISRLETGDINFTEQMIKSICREFNVNPDWFKDGIGEMFDNSDDDTMLMIDRIMTGENEFHKEIMKLCTKFDEKDLKDIERLIDKFLQMKKAD